MKAPVGGQTGMTKARLGGLAVAAALMLAYPGCAGDLGPGQWPPGNGGAGPGECVAGRVNQNLP